MGSGLRLLRDGQPFGTTGDLPIDKVELMLRLPARLLHAPKKRAAIGNQTYDAFLGFQPMNEDGPS